ncbi:hypothetical protein DXA10_14820, partial [Firmicutes bacterium AM55-24TS]
LGGASGSQYLTDIVEVKAATWHTLALKANGTVYAWGNNSHSQLGSTGSSSSRPVQVVTGQQGSASGYLEKVVELDAASEADSTWGTSIAVTESKEVYGWGYSNYGALGKTGEFGSPIKVSNINTAVGAALGGTDSGQFTYILKEDGTVSSLGYNGYGQLGNGTTTSSSAAQDVQNSEKLINGILQVTGSQNGYHGAFVKKDGTVWTVGLNSNGQLGNGSQDNKSRPIQVGGGGSNAMHISYGKIMHGTTVIEEFDNPNNIIGNITIAEDDTFVIDKSKITAKQSFSLLPDTDTLSTNDVNITSFNTNIATVDNNTGVVTPVKGMYGTAIILVKSGAVQSLIRIKIKPSETDDPKSVASPMVAAGSSHTIALRYDGTVWAWGYNGNGELGQGNTTTVYSPVQVKSADGSSYLTDIIEIAAGSNHNLALDKDGTVWAWGYGPQGQLGNRTTSNSSLPVKVIGVSDMVSIAAGYYNSFAVRKDGTVWAWGYNYAGQLGLGDGTNRTTAQQVLGGASGSQYLTDIVEVKAATWHTLALKANGTVYAWGCN